MHSGYPLRILCLSDDPADFSVYEHIVQAHGHTLTQAQDAQEACGLLQARAFDVVLVVDGPSASLQALGRRLLMNPSLNRDLRMVAITADPAAANEDLCLSHGFDACLRKPVDVRIFLESIVRRPTLADRMRRRDVLREWVRQEVESGLRRIDWCEVSGGEGAGRAATDRPRL